MVFAAVQDKAGYLATISQGTWMESSYAIVLFVTSNTNISQFIIADFFDDWPQKDAAH